MVGVQLTVEGIYCPCMKERARLEVTQFNSLAFGLLNIHWLIKNFSFTGFPHLIDIETEARKMALFQCVMVSQSKRIRPYIFLVALSALQKSIS